ncbi:hypothetical protein EI94DRAFT_1709461, partial [Lactarius quietus]
YGIVGDVKTPHTYPPKPFTWEFPAQIFTGSFPLTSFTRLSRVKLYLKSSHTKTHVKAVLDDIDHCFKQWTGNDSKALMKAVLTKFHYYRNIFQTTGVCNLNAGFNLLQQHSLSHYPQLIHLFGAPNGLCSSITESKHIKSVKNPYWDSN